MKILSCLQLTVQGIKYRIFGMVWMDRTVLVAYMHYMRSSASVGIENSTYFYTLAGLFTMAV